MRVTKTILLSASLTLSLHAVTIGELFEALKENPALKLDELQIKSAQIGRDSIKAEFYPKIDALLGYEHYNTPTGLLPIPPNKIMPMVQDTSIPQPFVSNMTEAGITASMPIFVKSLFTMLKRADALRISAQKRKKLQFLQKEALLLGADAQWIYLDNLLQALDFKEHSLRTSLKIVDLKVKNGRAPESQRYKLLEALEQITLSRNDIKINIENLKATIFELTGISLKKPVPLRKNGVITTQTLFALEPLQAKERADALELKAAREKLYPSLVASGKYFYKEGEAYNNDKDVDARYGSYGIYLKVPLFDKSKYAQIDQAKLRRQKSRIQIKKSERELQAKASRLKATLPLLEHSIKAAKRSAQNQKRLLRIAKVSFNNAGMTEEEYLRYEDAYQHALAKVYGFEAQRWQTIAQLAVLYGNNLKGIVQ
jgi:outer membrane protein TolC